MLTADRSLALAVSIEVVRSTQMKTYRRLVRRYTIWSQCDSYTRVRSSTRTTRTRTGLTIDERNGMFS